MLNFIEYFACERVGRWGQYKVGRWVWISTDLRPLDQTGAGRCLLWRRQCCSSPRASSNLDQSEVLIIEGVVLTSKLIVTTRWRKLFTSDPRRKHERSTRSETRRISFDFNKKANGKHKKVSFHFVIFSIFTIQVRVRRSGSARRDIRSLSSSYIHLVWIIQ